MMYHPKETSQALVNEDPGMSFPSCSSSYVIVFSIVLALSGGAYAQSDICSQGVVYTTDAGRQVTFIEAAPEGASIGDKRIGQKDILDESGDKIGVFRWIATVIQMGEGDSKPVYAVDKFYEFEDGILFGRSLDNVKSPVGDTSQVSIVSGRTSIHGGVGKYAGASGTKRHERDAETGRFTYHFDVACK